MQEPERPDRECDEEYHGNHARRKVQLAFFVELVRVAELVDGGDAHQEVGLEHAPEHGVIHQLVL